MPKAVGQVDPDHAAAVEEALEHEAGECVLRGLEEGGLMAKGESAGVGGGFSRTGGS